MDRAKWANVAQPYRIYVQNPDYIPAEMAKRRVDEREEEEIGGMIGNLEW